MGGAKVSEGMVVVDEVHVLVVLEHTNVWLNFSSVVLETESWVGTSDKCAKGFWKGHCSNSLNCSVFNCDRHQPPTSNPPNSASGAAAAAQFAAKFGNIWKSGWVRLPSTNGLLEVILIALCNTTCLEKQQCIGNIKNHIYDMMLCYFVVVMKRYPYPHT